MMDNSMLNIYLDEIGQRELLSSDEERRLSEQIRQGDMRALGRLVEANLRFVVKIAAQYRGKGMDMDDLISEGNIGLMNAAMKFDGGRGVPFVRYAVTFVRQQIERAIDKSAGMSGAVAGKKLPQKSNGAAAGYTLSVDAPLGNRSNMSLLSVLVNRNSPQADERVYSEAVESAVEKALTVLNERETQVVHSFFGLDRERETMAEIAEDLGVKRERVRQIRDRALRRLRKAYKRSLAELKK